MIDCKDIEARADEFLEGTDMFVVSCTSTPSAEVELIIDSDTRVGIDSCVALSKHIEGQMDRDAEDFSLMVASAGVGEELKLLRQYKKLVGESLEVLLYSGIKLTARLTGVDEGGIDVEYTQKQLVEMPSGKKKKQDVTINERYAFEDIKKACEYIDFK